MDLLTSLRELEAALTALRTTPWWNYYHWAEVAVFHKAAKWALRWNEKHTPEEDKAIARVIERGRIRAAALAAGRRPWTNRPGRIVLGFPSKIDDSIQPYIAVVPVGFNDWPANPTPVMHAESADDNDTAPQLTAPIRLDVVLHGSMAPNGMAEINFINAYGDDTETQDGATAPSHSRDEALPVGETSFALYPMGRGENCYRWAGERDVFEAIGAIGESYELHFSPLVLRGVSMGASGTWHIGLKHPDCFAALAPYCGYVDTHRFSHAPFDHFARVGALPEHQEKTLHMMDAIDYAANVGAVPVVAAVGRKDPFWDFTHELMKAAVAREGLELVNLVSPETGHEVDPPVFTEQMRRVNEQLADRSEYPRHVRFVTWTMKYATCHWLEIVRLKEHYRRAEVEGWIRNDGSIDLAEPINVTHLIVHAPPGLPRPIQVCVAGLSIDTTGSEDPSGVSLELTPNGWRSAQFSLPEPTDRVKHFFQGPIDDAFTRKFRCVRGTGTPWNARVHEWAMNRLARFQREYPRYFRAEVPVVDDRDLKLTDAATANLILFGDPGSNSWMANALPYWTDFLTWTPERITFGDREYDASSHVPLLIQRKVFRPDGAGHDLAWGYFVLNTGHTFIERPEEMQKLPWLINYLLFPRLGDWAILRVHEDDLDREDVVCAGFFDEEWGLPTAPGLQSRVL